MPRKTERTALYRLYDVDDHLLYIGISVNPDNRLKRHRSTKPWWPMVDGVSIHWYDTWHLASLAETAAIASERPQYNRQGTPAHRARISSLSRNLAPEKRHNRAVGLRARFLQTRTLRALLDQGLSEAEAQEQAKLARERYIAEHRHIDLP